MAVLVVDTDRRRQIPSEFLWVLQGLAKRAKKLYPSREPAEMISSSGRNRNRPQQSSMSRYMFSNGEIATGRYGD